MLLDRVLRKVRSRSALGARNDADEEIEDYITLKSCIASVRANIFDLEKHIITARSNILTTVRCIKTLYPPFATSELDCIFKIPEEIEALSSVSELRKSRDPNVLSQPINPLLNLKELLEIPPLIPPSERSISNPVTIPSSSPTLTIFLHQTPPLSAQLALLILKRAELTVALDHLERLLTFWIGVWGTMRTTHHNPNLSQYLLPDRPPLTGRNFYYVIGRKDVDCYSIQIRMEKEQELRRQEEAQERALYFKEREGMKRIDSGVDMEADVEKVE